MKLTDKQCVLFTILVVCLIILSNAIINKCLLDALYLIFIGIMAIRYVMVGKKI